MRIAGWTLLVGGLFLCVSVIWAALGFLMMGFCSISLQVAEYNRRRATNLTTLSAEPSVAPPGEHEVGSAKEQVLNKEASCRAVFVRDFLRQADMATTSWKVTAILLR